MQALKAVAQLLEKLLETVGTLLLQIWPVVLVLLTAVFFLVYTEQGIDVLASARGDAGEVFQLLVATFTLVAASSLCTAYLLMLPPDWDRHGFINVILKGRDERAARKMAAGVVAFLGLLIVMKLIIDYVIVVEFDVWRYLKTNAVLVGTYLAFLVTMNVVIMVALHRDALENIVRVAGGASIVALLGFALFPVALGMAIGAEFTLFLVLSSWLFATCLLVGYARANGLRYSFAILGALALLGVIVGWSGDPTSPARPIRCVAGDCQPAQGTWTVPEAFKAWRTQHEAGERPVLMMVAAAGGGARASYWTSVVLGRVTDAAPEAVRRHLFVASGVSGGALGLAVHRGLLASGTPACAESDWFFEDCARRFGRGDFLAPNVAALMTGDIVNGLLDRGLLTGRDVALELAWEEHWKAIVGNGAFAEPFSALWPDATKRPSLILNATSTRNGERLVISDLNAVTFLGRVTGCRTNLAEHARIPFSAAVNASARFPVIDPPGAIAIWPCDGEGVPAVETVADGGFHDNFGAASLLDVLDALQAYERDLGKRVRLVVVQITSDPTPGLAAGLDEQFTGDAFADIGPCAPRTPVMAQAPPPPARRSWPWRWLLAGADGQLEDIAAKQKALGASDPLKPAGPLGTLMKARERTGAVFPVELRRRVKALGGDYFHFAMDASVSAPLGWMMSRRAQRELDRLLDSKCHKAQLGELVAILHQR
jgi:hypothetical protein